MVSPGIIKYLPIQSREDVATQFKLDGPLAASDGKQVIVDDQRARPSRCIPARKMGTTIRLGVWLSIFFTT